MDADVLSPLRLSLQVATCATIVTLLVGIPVSYLLARKQFWGKDVVSLLLTLPWCCRQRSPVG